MYNKLYIIIFFKENIFIIYTLYIVDDLEIFLKM